LEQTAARMSNFFFAMGFVLALASPALAQGTGDVFADGPGNAKVHGASGFVCPAKVGLFERDAVGERDPQVNADFCAYSALDGVYGTITLVPLSNPYDPKTALVPDFVEQESAGGKMIREGAARLGAVNVYTRTYQTTSLEDLHYRTLFAAGAVGNWSVQVTMEFASPRDDAVEQEFLNAAYAGARKSMAAQ
jgi:hypothetical protein